MPFGKWNTSGELTWASGDAISASDLNDSIDETTPPIGAVIAWLKSFTGVPATLPGGWVECNGQVLSDTDSPLNGQTIPNLNASGGGTQRFLRGATTSGTTGGADTNSHTHTVSLPAHTYEYTSAGNDVYGRATNSVTTSAPSDTNILPSYYEVVYIIRIK